MNTVSSFLCCFFALFVVPGAVRAANPVAVTDVVYFTGSLITVSPLTNDTDADPGDTLTLASVSQPIHGRVDLLTGNRLRYMPDASFAGRESLTYTVADNANNTATGTILLINSAKLLHGSYGATAADSDTAPTFAASGYLSLVVTPKLLCTGKLEFAGKVYLLKKAIVPPFVTNFTFSDGNKLSIQYNPTTNRLEASAMIGANSYPFTLRRALTSGQAGDQPLAQGRWNSTETTAYLTATVTPTVSFVVGKSGQVRATGRLPDNKTWSRGGFLFAADENNPDLTKTVFPYYSALTYPDRSGAVFGRIEWEDNTTANHLFRWFKSPLVTDTVFGAGVDLTETLDTERYLIPGRQQRLIELAQENDGTNLRVILSGAGNVSTITSPGQLTPANVWKSIAPNLLRAKLTLQPKTGAFIVEFTNPATGKRLKTSGVVLQDSGLGLAPVLDGDNLGYVRVVNSN